MEVLLACKANTSVGHTVPAVRKCRCAAPDGMGLWGNRISSLHTPAHQALLLPQAPCSPFWLPTSPGTTTMAAVQTSRGVRPASGWEEGSSSRGFIQHQQTLKKPQIRKLSPRLIPAEQHHCPQPTQTISSSPNHNKVQSMRPTLLAATP